MEIPKVYFSSVEVGLSLSTLHLSASSPRPLHPQEGRQYRQAGEIQHHEVVQKEEQEGALAGGSKSYSELPAICDPACVKRDIGKTPCPHTRAHFRICLPARDGRDV